jgi:hypothetical protein
MAVNGSKRDTIAGITRPANWGRPRAGPGQRLADPVSPVTASAAITVSGTRTIPTVL